MTLGAFWGKEVQHHYLNQTVKRRSRLPSISEDPWLLQCGLHHLMEKVFNNLLEGMAHQRRSESCSFHLVALEPVRNPNPAGGPAAQDGYR